MTSMSELFDLTVKEIMGEPSAARALKLLAKAKEHGWHENPYTSLVIRLDKEGAEPFFVSWHLAEGANGKPSWRFQGGRARNLQPLGLNDALLYLEDPSVIYPEPPKEEEVKSCDGTTHHHFYGSTPPCASDSPAPGDDGKPEPRHG